MAPERPRALSTPHPMLVLAPAFARAAPSNIPRVGSPSSHPCPAQRIILPLAAPASLCPGSTSYRKPPPIRSTFLRCSLGSSHFLCWGDLLLFVPRDCELWEVRELSDPQPVARAWPAARSWQRLVAGRMTG